MLNDKKEIKSFIRGFRILFVLFILAGVTVICRIVWLQNFCAEKISGDDTIFTEIIPAARGKILSHDGRPLAVTVQEYRLYWDAGALPEKEEGVFESSYKELADSLASLYRRPAADFVKILKKGRKEHKRYMQLSPVKLSYKDAARAKNFPLFKHRLGGLIVTEVETRKYPYGNMARKIIGSINANMEGSGLEKSFNHKLKGKPGARVCYKVAGVRNIPVSDDGYIPPEDGMDIRSTIDVTIQEAAENALMEQLSKEPYTEGGTIVVMEVKTGAIRAMANLMKEDGVNLTECYNYATMHATEPGSTLKLSSLLALLEDGYVTLDSKVDDSGGSWSYRGIPIKDSHQGLGIISVRRAFEVSSNVCFAKLTAVSYQGCPEKYLARLNDLKLGERFNLEIDEEAPAVIHSPGDPSWSDVTLAMMGYGYGLLITPLHTLALYNAVANDGKMMKPYLVEAYCRDGRDIQVFQPKVMSSSICSKKTIRSAQEALRAVVTDGTARSCNDPRYSISGKTGTAQVALKEGGYKDRNGLKKYQASFAGYFPSENPQYSCIVVLYSKRIAHNFYGATWASPVFKSVADKIYASSLDWKEPIELSESPTAGRPAVNSVPAKTRGTGKGSGHVPDVTDMGLKDALCVLENEGYRVSFKGRGRVCGQTPEAGAELKTNGRVEIILGEKNTAEQ